tara:strand:+ start:1064 stop:1978 length:915 start_codon:yes stop_codon:yes gene_type:complete
MNQIVVAALYQFVSLPDYKVLRDSLYDLLSSYKIKGTLLVAHEGINGTVAGSRSGIDALVAFLEKDGRFNNLEYKESFASEQPFLRTKVRLKKEIVTLGVPGTDPNKKVGTYVDPENWNALLEDPETVVIDCRNTYEYEIGTFKKALNPGTDSFREFPEYVKKNFDPEKDKKVVMFCTGGIRCEKASSYMLEQGFENVYHLKGGILKYLEEMPEEKSLWNGQCFVFDDRVSVGHGVREGDYDQCHACRFPITEEKKKSDKYVPGVSCPRCFETQSEKNRRRAEERQKQIDLAKSRGQVHLGSGS